MKLKRLIKLLKNLFKGKNSKLYRYDSQKLDYVKVSSAKRIFNSILWIIAFGCVIVFTTWVEGYSDGYSDGVEHSKKEYLSSLEDKYMSKYDFNPEKNKAWKDSVFTDYKKRADLYLSRSIFKGTPLSGDIMSLCARNAYDSLGVLLPVELALSQAQWESGMGREGKSPVNNPFNIGEHDSGTVKWFQSTFEGTQEYYYYMCRDYLRCRTVDQLFINFVNCNGKRYASKPTYETTIRNQYYMIKKWLSVAMKKE